MTRQTFVQKQRRLQDEALFLGSQVAEALATSVEALKQRDMARAIQLMADSDDINKRCIAIEANTLALLATQQPMAGDLRTLAAVLEVALELDRIRNHAREITKINLKLGQASLYESFTDIAYMAEAAISMLHQALEAFAKQDVELARVIPAQDDTVDELYNRVCQKLQTTMKVNPNLVDQAICLSQVAHHLERVADRTTNICEWVVFIATGKMIEIKGDLNDQRII